MPSTTITETFIHTQAYALACHGDHTNQMFSCRAHSTSTEHGAQRRATLTHCCNQGTCLSTRLKTREIGPLNETFTRGNMHAQSDRIACEGSRARTEAMREGVVSVGNQGEGRTHTPHKQHSREINHTQSQWIPRRERWTGCGCNSSPRAMSLRRSSSACSISVPPMVPPLPIHTTHNSCAPKNTPALVSKREF